MSGTRVNKDVVRLLRSAPAFGSCVRLLRSAPAFGSCVRLLRSVASAEGHRLTHARAYEQALGGKPRRLDIGADMYRAAVGVLLGKRLITADDAGVAASARLWEAVEEAAIAKGGWLQLYQEGYASDDDSDSDVDFDATSDLVGAAFAEAHGDVVTYQLPMDFQVPRHSFGAHIGFAFGVAGVGLLALVVGPLVLVAGVVAAPFTLLYDALKRMTSRG